MPSFIMEDMNMKNLYNKITELCSQLNSLTNEELPKNGIEAITIHCIGTNLTGVQYANGDLPSILSLLSAAIKTVSNKSGIPLSDLLDMIYQTEKEIEQHKEEGD